MRNIKKECLEVSLGRRQNTGLQGLLRKSYYYKLISEAQKLIHRQIPEETYCTDRLASHVEIREEIFNGKNCKRAVLYLMSNGCEWALKSGHGCTMCGHLAKQTRRNETIPAADFIAQFEREFKRIDFAKFPLLNIYNNGTFLNDNEIPGEARREILRMISRNRDIRMLVLETRPEFVTVEKVREIRELVPNICVELAIGLEMKDDFYRAICINKGFSLRQFNVAARIITKELNLRTYVLLKPQFLSEKESIDLAIETIEHAFSVGATTVSLEAVTIQDYTLTSYLYKLGLYRTPWLWSIVEVVKGVKTPGKLIVGMFQFYPSPSTVPHNCQNCNDRVMEALRQYNRTLDRNSFDGLTCECKKEWREVLKAKPLQFENRLESIPEILSQLKGSV